MADFGEELLRRRGYLKEELWRVTFSYCTRAQGILVRDRGREESMAQLCQRYLGPDLAKVLEGADVETGYWALESTSQLAFGPEIRRL